MATKAQTNQPTMKHRLLRSAAKGYLAIRRLIPLPGSTAIFLTNQLAKHNDVSDPAMQLYLDHLRKRNGKSLAVPARKIDELLEDSCRVDVDMTKSQSLRTLKFTEKILKSNENIDWAHHYRGLAFARKGNLEKAVKHLKFARKLNSRRIESDYYAKVYQGMLEEKGSNLDEALKYYRHAAKLIKTKPEAEFNLLRVLITKCLQIEKDNKEDSAARIKPLAQEAAICGAKVLKLSPKAGEYHYHYARARSFLLDSKGAISAYRNALRIDPDVKEYHIELALELGKAGQYKAAIRSAKRALELDSRYMDAFMIWADLLAASEKLEDAVDKYHQALKIDKGHFKARLGLGRTYHRLGNHGQAIHELLKVKFESNEVVYLIARSYSLTGRLDDAIATYQSLTSDPSFTKDANYYLACAYANKQEWNKATDALTMCLELDPKQWKAYLYRGHCHIKDDKPDMAFIDYKRAQEQAPGEPEIAIAIARYHLTRKDFAPALETIRHISEGATPCHEISFIRGLVCEKMGDFENAIASYLDVPAADNVNSQTRIGIIQCHQRKFEEACQTLRVVVDSGHTPGSALFYLGYALAMTGDYSGALEIWRQLEKDNPDDQRLKLNIYRLCYLLGAQQVEAEQYEDAAKSWSQYLDSRPDDENLTRDLAEIYFRMALLDRAKGKDKHQAHESLQSAIEINANHPKAEFYMSLMKIFDGKVDEGIRTLDRLAARSPELEVRVLYHKALGYLRNGKTRDALELLKALCEHPDRTELEYPLEWLLALAYVRGGFWEEALTTLRLDLGQHASLETTVENRPDSHQTW